MLAGAIAGVCLSIGPLIAQTAPPPLDPLPEEIIADGAFRQDSTPSVTDESAIQSSTPIEGPLPTESPSTNQSPESIPISPEPASPETSTIGVPATSGNFLPSFDELQIDWFQMEGLKFRIGPFHVRLGLTVGLEYNDNIYATATNPIADYLTLVSPAITIGTGGWKGEAENFFLLNYTPQYRWYAQNKDRNRVNQNLSIRSNYKFSRFTTTNSLQFTRNDDATANQSANDFYTDLSINSLNAYYLGGKTFAQLGLNLRNSASSDSYTTVSASPQLGYALTPKTVISLGPYVGMVLLEGGDTQTFQGISATLNYNTLRKLQFTFTGGVQARQFQSEQSNGPSNFITPIFAFALNYQARERTSLQFDLSRDVGVSGLGGSFTTSQTNITNQIGLRLSQKLFRSIAFNLGFDYQILEYEGGTGDRTDTYFSATPALSYSFLKNQMILRLYYRRQQRTSDASLRGYTVNAIGTSIGYQF